MVRIVKRNDRKLECMEFSGANVRVSDPIVGREDNFSAGFTEYVEPCRFEWTFTYDEVFFMLEGSLALLMAGEEPARFEPGDMGAIEKGTTATIEVTERAYFLHFTQPAWREE